jgi:hypothetical protein
MNKENSPPNPNHGGDEVSGSKKKTKFVALYSSEGQALKKIVMLKGRHICDCQAAKHDLVNNCLQCGKIVCSQEGDCSK